MWKGQVCLRICLYNCCYTSTTYSLGICRHNNDLNTLRPRHNGRHFADDIFKCIFLNENVWNPIKISLKFVPKGPINYIPALVQIMAWRRSGDKPLSETMMARLLTHICVTRPQWVKSRWCEEWYINSLWSIGYLDVIFKCNFQFCFTDWRPQIFLF